MATEDFLDDNVDDELLKLVSESIEASVKVLNDGVHPVYGAALKLGTQCEKKSAHVLNHKLIGTIMFDLPLNKLLPEHGGDCKPAVFLEDVRTLLADDSEFIDRLSAKDTHWLETVSKRQNNRTPDAFVAIVPSSNDVVSVFYLYIYIKRR